MTTTALLEKLDKPVRYLKWEPAIHGGWVALGAAGNYHVYKDRRNGEVAYEVSNPFNHDNPRFPTADEAKAAAQADYERRILSALSLTPSDLEAIKAALVEREWQTIDTAPRDGSYVWLWNKHVSNPWEAPQRYRWSTHYSVFGLGGCWTDGLCTMGDRIDFDFWCAFLPATPSNPYETLPAPPRAALGKDKS